MFLMPGKQRKLTDYDFSYWIVEWYARAFTVPFFDGDD
jgi:hypothetical protein